MYDARGKARCLVTRPFMRQTGKRTGFWHNFGVGLLQSLKPPVL